MEKFVEIGKVGRAHGIAGELHVFLYNPDSDILNAVDRLTLRLNGVDSEVIVESARPSNKSWIVRFAGVSDRTATEKLKGAVIVVPRSALPPIEEDEFYIADLIGLEAFEDGVPLGTVTAARPQGDIEIVTVTGTETAVEVPLVADFLVSMDLAAGRIEFVDTAMLPAYPIRKRRVPGTGQSAS